MTTFNITTTIVCAVNILMCIANAVDNNWEIWTMAAIGWAACICIIFSKNEAEMVCKELRKELDAERVKHIDAITESRDMEKDYEY